MSNSYVAGTVVRLSNGTGFQDANGALGDPTTVQLKYQLSGGAVVTKVYGTDPVVRDGVGLYHFDLDTTAMNGVLEYEWLAPAGSTFQAIQSNVCLITPAAV
jgi:hypothetical protein